MTGKQVQIKKARADILKLEDAIRHQPGYDFEGRTLCKIRHYFAPGVYAREMFIPKDVLITGKIHKTEHLNILSQGKLSISNKGESMTVEAPFTYVSPIGTKRAIYALEDSTWTTIHVTEETDLDALEDELIAETFEEIDALLGVDEKVAIEYDGEEE